MIGALTYTDNEDWYKITISKDFCYTIKLTHYMYNIRYELYNSDLSKKVSEHNYIIGDENTPEVDVSELVLSTGTYYLKITGDRGNEVSHPIAVKNADIPIGEITHLYVNWDRDM